MQNNLIYDLFKNGEAETWMYSFYEGKGIIFAIEGDQGEIANMLMDIYDNAPEFQPAFVELAKYILRNTDN